MMFLVMRDLGLFVCVLMLGVSCSVPPGPAPRLKVEDAQELVFFAVIEGLYRDGVSTEVAESLARVDSQAGLPDNFVHGCPACHPVLDALRLYVGRPDFYMNKRHADSFGDGLDDEVNRRLMGPSQQERLDALHALVQRWVDERLESMAIAAEQRQEVRERIGEMRRKGMARLAAYQESREGLQFEHYAAWERCPSCDASFAASGGEPAVADR